MMRHVPLGYWFADPCTPSGTPCILSRSHADSPCNAAQRHAIHSCIQDGEKAWMLGPATGASNPVSSGHNPNSSDAVFTPTRRSRTSSIPGGVGGPGTPLGGMSTSYFSDASAAPSPAAGYKASSGMVHSHSNNSLYSRPSGGPASQWMASSRQYASAHYPTAHISGPNTPTHTGGNYGFGQPGSSRGGVFGEDEKDPLTWGGHHRQMSKGGDVALASFGGAPDAVVVAHGGSSSDVQGRAGAKIIDDDDDKVCGLMMQGVLWVALASWPGILQLIVILVIAGGPQEPAQLPDAICYLEGYYCFTQTPHMPPYISHQLKAAPGIKSYIIHLPMIITCSISSCSILYNLACPA